MIFSKASLWPMALMILLFNTSKLLLDETHLDVVRGFSNKDISTKCVNEESSTKCRNYNRQIKRIFSTVPLRPGSMLIRQD